MTWLHICVSFFFMAAGAFADYRVVHELRNFKEDGSQAQEGYVWYDSKLTLNDEGHYDQTVIKKIFAGDGSFEGPFSKTEKNYLTAEEVGFNTSHYRDCMDGKMEGELKSESLTVPAGTFKTCKQTLDGVSVWYVENSFNAIKVKRPHPNGPGYSVMEAIELELPPKPLVDDDR